jgi:hypothetical protein
MAQHRVQRHRCGSPHPRGANGIFLNTANVVVPGSRLFIEKGNKADVLLEVVFHGRSNREQIVIPLPTIAGSPLRPTPVVPEKCV